MSELKNKILELRQEGKSYREIESILGCSKGTIAYYCGKGQKDKTLERQTIRRKNPLIQKTERYQQRKRQKDKYRDFQRREGSKHGEYDKTFNWKDVEQKFKENPVCYITGESIDLSRPDTYHFDHIVPASRGGDNSLENLGLTTPTANRAKHDMTLEEFLDFCERVLRFHNRL